jgi:hypothetical protein
MKNIRIRWKAAIPAVGIVLGVVSDPSVLALMPEKWAHAVVAVSALAAIFAPAVATNRPPSSPASEPIAKKPKDEAELDYPYGQ